MSMLYEIIKSVSHRLRQNRLTVIFFVVGLTLSMLLVSVGISFACEIIYAGREKSRNAPPHGTLYSIGHKKNVKCTADDFVRIFDGIREDTGIILNNIMVHPNMSEVNLFNPVSAEWFVRDDGWHYPLISGRYYTAEEMKDRKKVALIGQKLQEYTREEAGKQYIDIDNDTYEVLGIVGLTNQMSMWDNRIFMPCTVLPKKTMESFLVEDGSLIMYNDSGDMKQDADVVNANGKLMIDGFKLKKNGKIQVEDVKKSLLNSQNPIFILAVLGYCVTLIYSINIVIFWIEKRKYEIGVRKAFGYTDRAVVKMIFGEMLGLVLVSGIAAILIQTVLSMLIGRISDYTLKLYRPNIIIGVAVVLLTAVLTSIKPVLNALKVPAATVLKEGERT